MPNSTYTALITGICIGMAVMALANAFQPRHITIAEPISAVVDFEHWMIDEEDL